LILSPVGVAGQRLGPFLRLKLMLGLCLGGGGAVRECGLGGRRLVPLGLAEQAVRGGEDFFSAPLS
jgi:hypothetical protein